MSSTDYTESTEATYSTTADETEEAESTEQTNSEEQGVMPVSNEDNTEKETTEEEPKEGEEKEGEAKEGEEGAAPQEGEEHKEPEPEPEVDPLEGVVYMKDEEAKELTLNAYGDPAYWEARYVAEPDNFEWYQDPEALSSLLKEYCEGGEGLKALVIGNGMSELPVVVANAGAEAVTAIDISKTAIKKSRRAHKESENITWKVMDACNMKFEAGEFKVVVDKACFDSILFGSENDAKQMISEVARVLAKKGVYIIVSCYAPQDIQSYFDNPAELLLKVEKTVELQKRLPSEAPHYVYVVRKVGKLLN